MIDRARFERDFYVVARWVFLDCARFILPKYRATFYYDREIPTLCVPARLLLRCYIYCPHYLILKSLTITYNAHQYVESDGPRMFSNDYCPRGNFFGIFSFSEILRNYISILFVRAAFPFSFVYR